MNKNKIHFCIIFIISIITFFNMDAYCTNKENVKERHFIDSLMINTEIKLKLNYGFLIQHHYEMTGYNSHFPMFEVSMQKQTYGKSLWQSYFNYPTVGVSALYTGFGKVEILGKAFALYPFIDFPINKNKINTLDIRFGVGLAYITKKFDPVNNYHNSIIGTNFNAAINLSLEYNRFIAEQLKLSVSAGITHFSNGCSYQPNSGINIISTAISATYLLNKPKEYIPKEKIQTSYKKIEPEYYIGMSFGSKRVIYLQDGNNEVYNFEFYIMDRISYLSKIGIAADIVYDATDIYTIKEQYNNEEFSYFQMLKPGIGIAYELMMGRASFLINFGYHPYGLDMRYGRWYQKIGLKVDITDYLFGRITLNTHFGVADFIGFGLGIKL